MKKIAVILLFLYLQPAFAQQRQFSFSEIDDRARAVEFAPPAALAKTLTSDYSTEPEKFRSIFTWITEHIAYRVKKNYTGVQAFNRNSRLFFTDTAWKSGNDFVAENVLQNRTAVCDGYARLFKTLCDYAGLRSAIISGFANGDYNRRAAFRCNHTWNAVFLDSSWHLLDLTWASGYTNYRGDEFIKRYDDNYFLAAPEVFIRDHYPDDLRWALMEKPPLPEAFNTEPYRNKSFSKYKISSFFPASGVIEASVGDTIHITLETADAAADGKIFCDTVPDFDRSLQKINTSIAFAVPDAADSRKQLQYHFYVANDAAEWLQVVYHHDNILRYRLKIKKQKDNPADSLTKEAAAFISFTKE